VEHLIALARNQLTEDAPKRGAANLLDVERALERNRRAFRARIWIWRGATAGALLAIAAAIVLLLPATRPPALMVEVLNGAVTASGHVDGTSRGTTLSFSDGTRLALAEQARARVAAITAHGAELELERGKVNVHVVPLPESRWTLRAGLHRVNVTGTAFDLAFDPDDQSLSLDLETGSVTVSGPLIDGELRLKAGEVLEVRPSDGGVRVLARAKLERAAPIKTEHALDDSSDDVGAAADLARPSSRRNEPSTKLVAKPDSWRQRVAAGRFDEVVELAERRGLTRVYERAELEEVEALADAARYARRNDVALDALAALRARFASTRAARDAAFFLGRIEEDRNSPARALEHYARYVEESPNGAYASHALGRKLVIVVARESAERAQATAREYLKRFPNGSHAGIAKGVLDERDVSGKAPSVR
jgi:tetratricopeptide (TPR) repeat protein